MDICNGIDIRKPVFRKKYIYDDDVFEYAINKFINRSSDTLKSIYDAAIKNELGWYILKTFSHNSMSKLSLKEIHKIVNSGKQSFEEKKYVIN